MQNHGRKKTNMQKKKLDHGHTKSKKPKYGDVMVIQLRWKAVWLRKKNEPCYEANTSAIDQQ